MSFVLFFEKKLAKLAERSDASLPTSICLLSILMFLFNNLSNLISDNLPNPFLHIVSFFLFLRLPFFFLQLFPLKVLVQL
jgi:hypothetical protein